MMNTMGTSCSYAFSCAAITIMLAVLVQGGPPSRDPFSTQPWNIKGDLLILDVGSLSFQGNHPMFPLYDEQGCADACLRTPGCNAWTFCSSKDGCGSGCKAYVANNPSVSYAANGNPTIPNPDWSKLQAIKGFGPWGVTANCKSVCGPNGSCSPGDAFPYGMCSLKKLADASKPEFWSNNPAEGWVSGFWKAPPECAGLSGRACIRCIRSPDPKSCLQCAANPAFKLTMLEGAFARTLTRADGCASCYSTTQPGKCVQCLTSNAACASCALQQLASSRTMDVASCIDCTNKLGAKFDQSCISCGALGGKPQQVQNCMSCLDKMSKVACDKTDYQPGCWNPKMDSSTCATCATSATSYDTCLSCMLSTPYSQDCGSCAIIAGADKQAQCYKCAKDAAHPGSGCADCVKYLPDTAQVQQCISCLANPATTKEGKTWCFGCQNWCKTFDTRAKCVACLGTKQEAYMQACACP